VPEPMPEIPESGSLEPTRAQLDLIGLKCPLPVLKTLAALARMRPGEVLEVATSDPLAAIDIPHAASTGGHELLDLRRADAVTRFTIRRGRR
jgi:tRNA 2-thiouridine synthesizing protein A